MEEKSKDETGVDAILKVSKEYVLLNKRKYGTERPEWKIWVLVHKQIVFLYVTGSSS